MAKKIGSGRKAGKPASRKTAARKLAAKRTPARKPAARTAAVRKNARKPVGAKTAAQPRAARGIRRDRAGSSSTHLADVRGAHERRDVGGVRLEVGRAGEGRVKRMIYPPGYSWSTHTKPHVDTDYCMHAHVGFLVNGRIDVVYADGCVEVYEAPQIVAVAPGHHGHVVGDEPAVLIEFDFEGDTIGRLGMPDAHRHE